MASFPDAYLSGQKAALTVSLTLVTFGFAQMRTVVATLWRQRAQWTTISFLLSVVGCILASISIVSFFLLLQTTYVPIPTVYQRLSFSVVYALQCIVTTIAYLHLSDVHEGRTWTMLALRVFSLAGFVSSGTGVGLSWAWPVNEFANISVFVGFCNFLAQSLFCYFFAVERSGSAMFMNDFTSQSRTDMQGTTHEVPTETTQESHNTAAAWKQNGMLATLILAVVIGLGHVISTLVDYVSADNYASGLLGFVAPAFLLFWSTVLLTVYGTLSYGRTHEQRKRGTKSASDMRDLASRVMSSGELKSRERRPSGPIQYNMGYMIAQQVPMQPSMVQGQQMTIQPQLYSSVHYTPQPIVLQAPTSAALGDFSSFSLPPLPFAGTEVGSQQHFPPQIQYFAGNSQQYFNW